FADDQAKRNRSQQKTSQEQDDRFHVAPQKTRAPLVSFSHAKDDGSPNETKALPELILDVAQIRVVHQLGLVDKKHKRRRFHSRLGSIKDLEAPAVIGRRLPAKRGLVEDFVEPAGGNPQGVLIGDVRGKFKN